MHVPVERSRKKTILMLLCLTLLGLLLAFASSLYLEQIPPLWWDEGWTMSVARNWVQSGFYGQFLDGEKQPPGLSAAFPVVAQVALSFRLFGVGVWQGRLPGCILFGWRCLCF